ncbi:LPXTG cell wall anchor domain-containing protein [Micromonospora sagamiensis]|uniref:LPXTG-motif cell wall-anchored protein n=1 Tax=Micromonospora sagamiensis TaxID=47875 RepID=A0A562WNK9_9ACTN|nr:LPXTG cell wall anchor domain-containing protein [Micromonospora sagamiensis]TWJ31933.1 LPXTG-motif cell wall-anchored protein [Micromonospora sagamiensis]BCL15013.1 hypothetical protein GCM10017556_27520 [Micromonospora sagamiensis]
MLNPYARRLLAGLGVVAALVATPANPASADLSDVKIDFYFPDVTVAAGSPGKVESAILSASRPVVLRDVTMRFDFSGLSGKVIVSEPDDFGYCTTPEPSVLLCTDPFEVSLEEWGLAGILPVTIAPTDGTDEATGKLKVTFSAAGVDPLTRESSVRVGEGVDLAAGPETETSAKPGEAFDASLAVRNAGTTTVKGSSLVFFGDHALRAGEKYRNCTYDGDHLRTCNFDEELAPGTDYRASLDLVLGKDTYAPGRAYGEAIWMTRAEYEDFAAYLAEQGVSTGEPGTGGTLTLTTGRRQARAAQADTDPMNNHGLITVTTTGKNGSDLAAIGDKLTGAAGAKVTATVGFRNNGPATLDYTRAGSSVTYVRVGVPEGTTVVEAPESCAPVKGEEWGEPGEAGGRSYFCFAGSLAIAGEDETFDFTLRVDKVVPNAKGTVEVNVSCQCDGGFDHDLKPANDTAAVLVNAAGGGGGGTGDGDGGLPVTGAQTGLIVGVGGLLLALGVGGFVLSRRRRTRFVA